MTTIGDVLLERKELLGNHPEPEILTLTEGRGFVTQASRFGKRLATDDTSNYKVIRRNEFAFNPYLLWSGAIARNENFEKAIISPLYPTFSVREGVDPAYAEMLLSSLPVRKLYDSISFGSIPRRRRASISDFLNLPLPSIPTLEKQRHIAKVLHLASESAQTALSEVAQSSHLELEIFRSIFAPRGVWVCDTIPLKEITKTHGGGTPSKKISAYWDGDIPWVTPKDFRSHIIHQSQDHITQEGSMASSAKVHPRKSVAIVTRGMILARRVPIAELDLDATTNQDVRVIHPIDGISSEVLLNSIRAQAGTLFQAVATAAHGTKRLETSVLDQLQIPQISNEAQDDFLKISSMVRSHHLVLRQKSEMVRELHDSLQYRAFRGEL